MKSKLITLLLIAMLVIGILLIFINPIQNKMIQSNSQALLEEVVMPVDTVVEASFDFKAVQSIAFTDVLKAQFEKKNFTVIGAINIPTVGLELPIGKGVSEAVLLYGAGTMKPDQQLGQGNYALASHYYEGKDILFGPLYNVQMGDSIFVSDTTHVYEYTVTVKEIILDSDVQVIYDVPDQTLLTLITCAEEGTKRLLVQGEFLSKSILE